MRHTTDHAKLVRTLGILACGFLACSPADPPLATDGGIDPDPPDATAFPDARARACDAGSTLGSACVFDVDCDDACFCNGLERCVAGACMSSDRAACDDGVDCTADACDEVDASCEHAARDELCRDEDYCDGEEVCDLQLGCIDGRPADCDDGNLCTVDRCDPEVGECLHMLRDLDGDGFADDRCRGGRDCNDDPGSGELVYPGAPEVCGNGVDDDCDRSTRDVDDRDGDGIDCTEDCADDDPTRGPGFPERCTNGVDDDCDGAIDLDDDDCVVTFPGDGCLSPLDVTNTTETVDIGALRRDGGVSCDRGDAAYVDAFFSVRVDAVPTRVRVSTRTGAVHLMSFAAECGEPSSELLCRAGTPSITESFDVTTTGTYWVGVSTAAPSGTLTVTATLVNLATP